MARPTAAALASTMLLALPPSIAIAETPLTPVPAPSERPYPYEILGLQPGDSLDDVMAVFSERSDDEPTGETETIQISSPDNRVMEFEYERFRRIGDVGLHGRMGGADQDQVTAYLASTVLEQRPLDISRNISQPNDELPEALALKAQIEELYGPPSKLETSTGSMTMIYAWGTDGFITDLDNQEEREFSYTNRFGESATTSFRPCTANTTAQAYTGVVQYNFAYPRRDDIMPDCVARFTVTHSSRPGRVGISFSLTDYELGRLHRDSLDEQIIETLTGDTQVAPSDMDL